MPGLNSSSPIPSRRSGGAVPQNPQGHYEMPQHQHNTSQHQPQTALNQLRHSQPPYPQQPTAPQNNNQGSLPAGFVPVGDALLRPGTPPQNNAVPFGNFQPTQPQPQQPAQPSLLNQTGQGSIEAAPTPTARPQANQRPTGQQPRPQITQFDQQDPAKIEPQGVVQVTNDVALPVLKIKDGVVQRADQLEQFLQDMRSSS